MQILTQSLLDATHKASRFLQRDFAELEMLQTSVTKPSDFINRSLRKVRKKLIENLENHPYPILDYTETPKEEHDQAIVIVPMDSVLNFSRALPFFASASFFIQKQQNEWQALNLAINFPALSESYYAEKTGGSWVEKYILNDKSFRLRVAGCRSLDEAAVGGDNFNMQIAKNNFNFNSIFYAACTLSSGKIDIVHLNNIPYLLSLALELITKEATGASKYHNKNFIGTNPSLIKACDIFFSK